MVKDFWCADAQVKVWRRSFDIPPPVLEAGGEFDLSKDRRYAGIAIPSTESLKDTIARVLPSTTQTADFTRTVWPQTTQKALLGQITSDEMMRTFDRLYFG